MKYQSIKTIFVSLLFLLTAQLSFAGAIQGKVFKDWQGSCQDVNGKEICFVVQPLYVDNKATIMVTTVDLVQHPKLPVVTFRLSKMLDATKDVQFKVDKNQAIGLKAKCSETACLVHFLLDKRMMAEFKRGKQGVLAFIATDTKKPRYFPVSLSCFTKARSALNKG